MCSCCKWSQAPEKYLATHHTFQIILAAIMQAAARGELDLLALSSGPSWTQISRSWRASVDPYSSRSAFLGGTLSPIKASNKLCVASASAIVSLLKFRVSGSIVVDHNCAGIISPRPCTTITHSNGVQCMYALFRDQTMSAYIPQVRHKTRPCWCFMTKDFLQSITRS